MPADPTIKDIALEVNVSYATVSRALNNKGGVKADTKRRILQAAKNLNYRPNAIARGLVKRRTHTFGLIIPDITNPFFPEVARGVEDAAQQAGYSVFLCNTNWNSGKERRYIELLSEKRIDGLIIAPVARGSRAAAGLIGSMPCVYLGRTPKSGKSGFVTIDNEKGGFLATEHLIRSGKTPVGFIGAPEDSPTLEERLRGYKNALAAYGEKLDERYIRFGDFTRETGYNLIRKMFEARPAPRGVFGENDLLAVGALQGARDMGLRVPDDLAVVGFDDIPIAAFPEIRLTTIGQPKYEMGALAVRILLDGMRNGGEPGEAKRRVILDPCLIKRSSA